MKDATFYAEQVKIGEVSPKELIFDFVKKAEQEKELNAFVELDPLSALEELADASDVQKESPFFGVPFPLKDLGQGKAGWLQTSGSRLFTEFQAFETSNYTKAVERAGFIPLGITAAPEFGFKNVTDPSSHGVTRNAWNPKYHAGGSSGGAASVVASGISPIAGASDGGGSIRIPASFSGLLGLKPSRGNIVTGPSSWRDWQGASVNFILGVSVRDARSMLKVLEPTNQISPFSQPKETPVSMSRPLKVALCMDSPVGNAVSDEAKQGVKDAALFLESQGHIIEEVPYPIDGHQLIRSYYQMNGGETANMIQQISLGVGRELTQEDMEPMSWTIYQYGKTLSAADYVASLESWDQAANTMERLFQHYDLFLSPTATTMAPLVTEDLQSDSIRRQMSHADELNQKELGDLVYGMFEKSLWITPYTQLSNLTGQPAISLPTHVTKEGLPIGVQLMAAKGQDRFLLDVAELFEVNQRFILPKVYR